MRPGKREHDLDAKTYRRKMLNPEFRTSRDHRRPERGDTIAVAKYFLTAPPTLVSPFLRPRMGNGTCGLQNTLNSQT